MKDSLLFFIHGLGGNAVETWGKFPELIRAEPDLGGQFDVALFSYPTSLFRFPFGRKTPKVQTLASGLRTEINNRFPKYKSIVLVCHSLGGLVGRWYVLEEVKSKRTLRVDKMLLYAVPNNGASLASLGESMFGRPLFWKNYQIRQLCKDSDLISVLNSDWAREEVNKCVAIKFVVAGQDGVVDENSAIGFWGNNNVETVSHKGHVDVVKPQDKNDMAFLILRTFVCKPRRRRTGGEWPPIWNVPHLRNPNFTGREELLSSLRETLTSKRAAAVTQVIHGLGAVGKTQLATEYAYRFASEYETVWWIRSEDPTTLATDYAGLASKLNLPEKDTPDQGVVIAAVRHWLNQNGNWLLIFDNAQKSQELVPYLPQAKTGDVIITSRSTTWDGVANAFKVSKFDRGESVAYLCNRTKDNDRKAADDLAKELGDLPLALAQAAGYINSARRTIADYLALYRQHPKELLSRQKPGMEYPHTVATTWALSLDQGRKQSPFAEDLLKLSSFFAPDNIPRRILQAGLQVMKNADDLAFDEALAALQDNSLVEATGDSVSLHRLVQAVTKDQMPENEKKQLVGVAVVVLGDTFSTLDAPPNDVRSWPLCELLLPHALAAVLEAEEVQESLLGVGSVLNNLGMYLHGRANFVRSESLFRRSLKIREEQLGADHLDVATSLNNLAVLLKNRGSMRKRSRSFVGR